MKKLRRNKYRVWDEKANCWDTTGYYPLYPNQYLVSQGRIFLQYTGIDDEEATEVYEGDIVMFEDIIKGIVTWGDGCWTVVDMDTNKVDELSSYNKIKVIGNEYEM